jgi:16S rRNA (cytidine1402-2'-O)-methyltransferase
MHSLPKKKGILYIVATPIGNLADITQRAVDILAHVDLIAAEDTRHSQKLMEHYQIRTPLLSLHDYNEDKKSVDIIKHLQEGRDIALISDAGTPLISDPGYRLVSKAKHTGIDVCPIPGPCAFIAALCASGLATDRFRFEGFLPAKAGTRRHHLEALRDETVTLIFYEAPHRALECLDDMITVFGPARLATIAKELTKHYENIKLGPLSELKQWLESEQALQQGEFVILVSGKITAISDQDEKDLQAMLTVLLKELPLSQAVRICSHLTKANKNQVYKLAVALAASDINITLPPKN